MTSHATTFFTPRVTSRHLLVRAAGSPAGHNQRVVRARLGAADCFVPWVTQAPRRTRAARRPAVRPARVRPVSYPAGGARRGGPAAGRGRRGRAGRAGPTAR